MKVNELRGKIKSRKKDELEKLIVEMYKQIPKKIREEKDIDQLIDDPALFKNRRKSTKQSVLNLDVTEVESEVKQFIEHARAQYYIAPNRTISKKERSKWRFTAKRLVDQVTELSNQPEHQKASSILLEDLYKLFCYASNYYVFASDEPFHTLKIPQETFLSRVVLLKKKVDEPQKWIRDSLLLILEEESDHETLTSTLLETLLETLNNAPLKEEAIRIAENLMEEKQINYKNRKNRKRISEYKYENDINNLTEMIFMLQSVLGELEKAAVFFKQHYVRHREEIVLYVLLGLIMEYQSVRDWLKEYEDAVERGIEPRYSLVTAYEYIKDKNEFPEYVWSV